jgi:hypothetical protein
MLSLLRLKTPMAEGRALNNELAQKVDLRGCNHGGAGESLAELRLVDFRIV